MNTKIVKTGKQSFEVEDASKITSKTIKLDIGECHVFKWVGIIESIDDHTITLRHELPELPVIGSEVQSVYAIYPEEL